MGDTKSRETYFRNLSSPMTREPSTKKVMTGMHELKHFLVRLPHESGFKDDKRLKISVFKALYYAATKNGYFLNEIFDDVDDQRHKDPWLYQATDEIPFYEKVIPFRYEHSPNQVCGRVLQPREKVYRCADCGYDDTCVLCSFCFRKEDHEGHNVSTYVSQANGGMCDCGDESAFVKKLNCACLPRDIADYELCEEFKTHIEGTVKTALDYVLDVTNYSINTLPFIHKNINGQGDLAITSEHISELSSLPRDVYGIEDVNSIDRWFLILWNDEDHDYPEAETGIRAATGMDEHKAKHVANEINRKGRAVLREAPHYGDLLESQKAAQVDGLVATISTARDYMRECIILHIFDWLQDITSFKGDFGFREAAKQALAHALLEPGYKLSKPIPSEFLRSSTMKTQVHCLVNGIAINGDLLNLDSCQVKPDARLQDLTEPLNSVMMKGPGDKLVRSRILFLLAFEVRFASNIRKRFTSSILPVLFIEPTIKAAFCEQYVDAYPLLMSILAFADREEELASSGDISVQLFTCPRTNKWIIQSDKLVKLLYPLCKLIEEKSSAINENGVSNLVDVVFDIRSKRENSAIQNTIKMCIENITRVLTKNDEKDLLNFVLRHENLLLFLLFLRFFQGLSPVLRKTGDHVERESITEFYSFILKAVPISSIVFHATRVADLDYVSAESGLGQITEYLRSGAGKSNDAKFRVSKDPVSPLNPINYFLSFIVESMGLENAKGCLSSADASFWQISKTSLRTVILMSQVKIGLWIRNGMTATRQIRYLLDTLADTTYSRDLHLVQVSAIIDDPEKTLWNILGGWELSEWFLGKVGPDNTVYEQKFSFACEKLILFLYKLLVDRLHFNEQTNASIADSVRRAICYALCEEPRSYSNLKRLLPSYLSKFDDFDRILQECADFQAPVGLYDVGIYRLKPSVQENLDPMGQGGGDSTQSVFESLYASIAKCKSVDSKKVILSPKICFCDSPYVNARLGKLYRTKTFAKLIYKLLQVAIDKDDEEFLPHLLHLLHAALLDGKLVFGHNYLDKSFVTIPICNLLLSVAESHMSSHVASKADYLLDCFISSDGNVMDSLTDCFGEAHIEAFKHRKDSLSDTKRQKFTKLAQTRKAKIMKKFAKQREVFMQNHETDGDVTQNPVDTPQMSAPRNCVYCGEPESVEKPFGIPGVIRLASVFWELSLTDLELVTHAFSSYSTALETKKDEVYSKGYDQKFRHSADVASSCAHGVHILCQQRARHLNSFPNPCPLCHNLYEDVIPSFLHGHQFLESLVLDGKPITSNPSDLTSVYCKERNQQLLGSVVRNEYFQKGGFLLDKYPKGIWSVFKKPRLNSRDAAGDIDVGVLRKVEGLIANTIAAHEISLRIEGEKEAQCVVEGIPSSLHQLIRSLIQCRVLLYETQRPTFEKLLAHVKSNELSKRALNGRSILNEIISSLFTTGESLRTLFRYGVTKLLAVTSKILCSEYYEFLLDTRVITANAVDCSAIKATAAYCEEMLGPLHMKFSSKSPLYYEKLFMTLEKCVLPLLRQLVMLQSIVRCEHEDYREGSPISRLGSSNAPSANERQACLSDSFCEVLRLPKLLEILSSSRNNKGLEFEYNILREFTSGLKSPKMTYEELTVDYPNVPRLLNLPDDFSLLLTDPMHVSPSDSICLHCRERVPPWLRPSHQSECSAMCLIFCPEENTVSTVIELGLNLFEIKLPGPYMTTHGEIRTPSLVEKARLNRLRYAHLNKLWINQELFGFATRTMFGERMSPLEAGAADEFEEDPLEDLSIWD